MYVPNPTPTDPPTHRTARSEVRSSKRVWGVALAAASVVVSAIPASALSIRIVENSSTRFVVDVDWGSTVSPLAVSGVSGPGSYALLGSDPLLEEFAPHVAPGLQVMSEQSLLGDSLYLRFDAVQVASGPPSSGRVEVGLNFTVFSPPHSRSFDDFSYWVLTSSLQEARLDGNDYGVRWVLGTPIPTPDTGVSGMMLASGLVGLTLLGRATKRPVKV